MVKVILDNCVNISQHLRKYRSQNKINAEIVNSVTFVVMIIA